jgi:hypothetical protein
MTTKRCQCTHACNQGRDCPARSASIAPIIPAIALALAFIWVGHMIALSLSLPVQEVPW